MFKLCVRRKKAEILCANKHQKLKSLPVSQKQACPASPEWSGEMRHEATFQWPCITASAPEVPGRSDGRPEHSSWLSPRRGSGDPGLPPGCGGGWLGEEMGPFPSGRAVTSLQSEWPHRGLDNAVLLSHRTHFPETLISDTQSYDRLLSFLICELSPHQNLCHDGCALTTRLTFTQSLSVPGGHVG